MPNPLYEMLHPQAAGGAQANPLQGMLNRLQGSPLQRVSQAMQAMRNPAAFVKQQCSDIPDNILNDPNKVLAYLKQTRGITDQQIQELMNAIPRF